MDNVDRYLAASQANDIDELLDTLAPDAELISPLSGRMVFRGHGDLRCVLAAIYGTLKDVRWQHKVGDSGMCVITGTARVGPLILEDASAVELDDAARIRRIKPHLRPWLATTLLAIKLAPKIGRHPGIVGRAVQLGHRSTPR